MSVHQIKYSYLDVPTVERFSESNAFIRGLMGPFGCLPGDSEFLSANGWKRMDAYQPGDLVAQWSAHTGEIGFVEPSFFHSMPCEEFIEFDSGSLVMRLSDEHRVPHFDWAGRFTVKTAAEIARKPSRRHIPTTFEGQSAHRLDMSDDLIRFAVMMHADGHFPKQGRKATVALRKERKKARLRELLGRIGLSYDERVYGGRPTESVFSFEPPVVGKRFTGGWWRASAHQLRVVMDEVRHWDGHDGEIFVYSSAHKEDADFIQYAAHACGLRATISKVEHENPAWLPNYRVNIRKGDNAKNRAMIREHTKISRVAALNHRKYCFTVPTGFFVARCDDSVFITGNSGKSSGCVTEIINRAQAQKLSPDGKRKTRFACIRNTFPELRGTTIKTLFQWLPPAHFGTYVENKHTYMVKAFDRCDVEIVFLALDKPDDLKQLLSLELTGAWLNEAREIPWAVWEVLQGRVGRFPAMVDGGPSWSGIWADTNPPDTDSKWYKFFEEKNWVADFRKLQREGHLPMSMREEDYAEIFKQPGGLEANAENIKNLPGGKLYYARLSAGKDQEWIKVYVDGDYGFVIDGKPVFHEYKDAIHCKAVEPIEGLPVYRGWDWGLTPSCVFSQELPDGRWLVFDEMVSESMGIDRFSDDVLEHCGRAFRGANVSFIDDGDPAGQQRAQTDERTCFDILHAKGIMVEPSEVSIAKRLESVRLPLRRMAGEGAQFVLHPRCKTLRKGFMGGYRFRRMQVSGERYTEKPDKNNFSHPMDALQYTACRLFGGMLVSPRFQEEAAPFSGDVDVFGQGRSEFCGY